MRYLILIAALFFSTVQAEPPKIYSQNGQYLGTLSNNPYDRDSVSNPYGRYGSQYSSDSINNPYGKYGSQFSSQSPNNPYATSPPIIIGR
jgi:hypothetical protein